jgi:hypothetical protein
MKKLNICIAGAAALLCFNCGDSSSDKIVGTSEELNELADNDSSSSTKDTKQSSSSVNDKQSSSSTDLSSSSIGDAQNPPSDKGSLDYYVWQYRLSKPSKFDKGVLAVNTIRATASGTPANNVQDATMYGEENVIKEGVLEFTKDNVEKVAKYFPKASEKYASLINSVKDGVNECGLYAFNLYGSTKYAGYILEGISKDTMKVVDILAEECETGDDHMLVQFLISYCGDISSKPATIHTTATSDIAEDECPAAKTDEEWVSTFEAKDINSSSSKKEPNSSSSNGEIATCRHISNNVATEDGTNCNSMIDTSIVIDCATGEKMKCEANYWVRDVCAPGGDCDGDGIPDGIYRPDLESCDTDTLLYFYGRSYQCIENKWVYLPPPGPDSTYSQARNVSVLPRQGMAVTPRVVIVKNADGTISIRDDGYNATNNFVMEAVYTEISGDTIIVDVIYPDGANLRSFQISALTFTVSKVYANVKYLKYKDDDRVKEIHEVDELPPCASSSTCQECGEGLEC